MLKKNVPLLLLIRTKREWHWKPSIEERRQGFLGWHQRGYLPHFDAPNVTQMITFMLADSFPAKRNAEWESVLNESGDSFRRRRLEEWLDRGLGECHLRRPDVAKPMEEILLAGDGKDFRMQAWCIMPNHVHAVVDVRGVPLAKLINRWKGKSARLINKLLGRRGSLWQEDYFDTLIRGADHLKKAIRYTEQNPCKATMVRDPSEWPFGSARIRDKYQRLPWQRGS